MCLKCSLDFFFFFFFFSLSSVGTITFSLVLKKEESTVPMFNHFQSIWSPWPAELEALSLDLLGYYGMVIFPKDMDMLLALTDSEVSLQVMLNSHSLPSRPDPWWFSCKLNKPIQLGSLAGSRRLWAYPYSIGYTNKTSMHNSQSYGLKQPVFPVVVKAEYLTAHSTERTGSPFPGQKQRFVDKEVSEVSLALNHTEEEWVHCFIQKAFGAK